MAVLRRLLPALWQARHRCAKNKRPVRGDNRTGQSHMGAWGGWALAPNIAMGRNYPLPHILVAEGLAHVQNGRRFFLTLRKPVFGGGIPIVRRFAGCRRSPIFQTPWSRQADRAPECPAIPSVLKRFRPSSSLAWPPHW